MINALQVYLYYITPKITLQYVHQTYVLKHDGFGDICTPFISKSKKDKDIMM
ncbi:MAG: hypothetical protein CM1200mP12_16180 [Gammaproteobacteria bacterium]|nr:MAG: hypothetical protein CM1200mP12_16180 [Gammaproteobacteria bacterium]